MRSRRARTLLPRVAVALFLVSVGARAARIVRASASGEIDSGDDERVVRRATLDAVSRFVRDAPPTGWLTDVKTSLLLLPAEPPGSRVLHGEPAFCGQRLDGAGRSFAVLPQWDLPEAASGPDDPVERALAWVEARGGLSEGRVGVVTGGGANAAWRIARDVSRGENASVPEVAGDAGLAAVVVDVRALRAWRARRAQEPVAAGR